MSASIEGVSVSTIASFVFNGSPKFSVGVSNPLQVLGKFSQSVSISTSVQSQSGLSLVVRFSSSFNGPPNFSVGFPSLSFQYSFNSQY